MKKLLVFALIASASAYAAEVELGPSHIQGSSSYQGSITENESKNIVLITKEDIAKKNYPDLVAIFQDSPVTMVTHTPAGPLIALRGSGEKTIMRVKVLLDGNNITSIDEAMGVIPFNAIPVSSIEKIEIIPGGGISLYGSGSSSGVINIVTKQGVTKDYGQVNLGFSSFHNRELSLNKGLSLGDKVFVNVALEGKKGNGYRDEDKASKFNLMSSVNYQINDKNKLKVSYAKFHENRDTTDEISLWELKRDRRKAGESLANTVSNRDAYAFNYELQATDNLRLNFDAHHADYSRDIKQAATPLFTYLPGGSFLSGRYNAKRRLDPVLLHVPQSLKGKFEEKTTDFRFKGNYKYADGRGSLDFGVDSLEQKLLREMKGEIGPYNFNDAQVLFHGQNEKRISADRLNASEESYATPFFKYLVLGYIFADPGTPDEPGFAKAMDKADAFKRLPYEKIMFASYKRMYETAKKRKILDYLGFTEEAMQAYEKEFKDLQDLYKNGSPADIAAKEAELRKIKCEFARAEGSLAGKYLEEMDQSKAMALMMDLQAKKVALKKAKENGDETSVAALKEEIKANNILLGDVFLSGMSSMVEEFAVGVNDVKLKDILQDGMYTNEKKDSVPVKVFDHYEGDPEYGMEIVYRYLDMPVDENTTFGDLIDFLDENTDPHILMSNVVNAKVDVKKDTNSFYLYNDFDLTDKLSMNAGLRFEQAKYAGSRRSEVTANVIKIGEKDIDEEKFNKFVGRFLGVSKAYRMDVGVDQSQNLNEENGLKKIYDDLRKEFDEKGVISLPMEYISSDIHKRENNLGGELGFNYKLNDDNTIYTKLERTFTSPVPTQLTNKTFDPVNRVKVYWDSNLQTEIVHNFEIGFRGALTDNVTYSLAGFMSDTKDEIVTLVKNANSHMNREWRFINLEKTRRLGIELQSEQFFDKLHLKESFTYVDPKVISNDYKSQLRAIVDTQKKTLIDNHRYYDQAYLEQRGLQGKDLEKALSILDKVYKDPEYLEIAKNYRFELSQEIPYVQDPEKKPIIAYRDKILDTLTEEERETIGYPLSQSILSDAYYLDEVEEYVEEKDYVAAIQSGNYIKKGDRIPLAPKVKATFGADYQFTDRLKLGMNMTYVGDYYTAEPSYGYEIVKTKVDGHFLTDLYGTYNFTPETSVKLGINNVFNHEYNQRQDSDTAVPAAGRTYSIGISHRF